MKIICIGLNYSEHVAEQGMTPPAEPLIFGKFATTVIGPGEPIVIPPEATHVDSEAELAVEIGRSGRRIADDDALDFVAGYRCSNDVSARNLQFADKQWTRAKGFDTFCPLGPVLETEFDLASGTVETLLNGQRKQYSPLTAMIFPVDVIIPWVSRVMTLVPGDVIATGTPAGVSPMKAGDVVEVVIAGIGTLRNPVVDRSI